MAGTLVVEVGPLEAKSDFSNHFRLDFYMLFSHSNHRHLQSLSCLLNSKHCLMRLHNYHIKTWICKTVGIKTLGIKNSGIKNLSILSHTLRSSSAKRSHLPGDHICYHFYLHLSFSPPHPVTVSALISAL